MLGKSAYAETGTTQETAANSSQSSQEGGDLPSSAQSTHSSEFHKFSRRQRIFRSLFHVWDIPLMHSETACLAANEKFNRSSYVRRTVVTG